MTIRYALKRKDVWNAYWFAWRKGWSLKLAQVVIAGCVFLVSLSRLAPGGAASSRQFALALMFAFIAIIWLPFYPLLRFKAQVRTLTIGPQGISTAIGDISGEVPWTSVGNIRRDGDRLYIARRTGNSFAIPDHAFSSVDERERFEAEAIRFWRATGA